MESNTTISTGEGCFMPELMKRRILEIAVSSCPELRDKFNLDCIDNELNAGFYEMDLLDGVTVWSAGMFKLAERDPALGSPTAAEVVLNFAAPEDNDGYLNDSHGIAEGQKKYGIGFLRSVTFRGNPRIFKYIVLPFTDSSEKVIGLCGWLVPEPINQVENSTVEPRLPGKDKNALEKAIANKHNVIANIFHEVRIPINSVYLGLQSLEEELNDPELKQLVSTMRQSTERAIFILNDTLDYSKLELGFANIKKSPTNISTCIQQCVNEFKVSAQRHNIHLSMNIICDCVCEIDGIRITQVLCNLVSNALKFTPHYGCITITANHIEEDNGEWSVISVSDTGVGLSPESLTQVFIPFHQIDNQIEGGKGMGIGLSICKKIIAAHNGEIEAHSSLGEGSTFVVKLPASSRSVDAASEEIVEAKKPRVRGEMEGLHVLLVDDDEISLRVLKRMLTKSGCSVDTLKDGKEFLEYTRTPAKKSYNMVLLDDFMTTLDGTNAIRTARGEGFQLFTVLLTGNMNDQIYECGANAVLHKPLKFSDLREVVHKYLL